MLTSTSKPWYRSRGMVGSAMTVAGSAGVMAPEVLDLIVWGVQMALSHGTDVQRPEIDPARLGLGIYGLVSGLLGWVGRLGAKQPIGG